MRNKQRILTILLVLCLTFGMLTASTTGTFAEGEKWTILINDQRWVEDPGNVVEGRDDKPWRDLQTFVAMSSPKIVIAINGGAV